MYGLYQTHMIYVKTDMKRLEEGHAISLYP